ncbi:MAG: BMC domain-containing protein, partial [Tepidisphaeraceae bacterium]
MKPSLGLIEVTGFAATLVVLDRLDKAADVRLLQVELNDLYGAVIKVAGAAAAVRAALEAARAVGEQLHANVIAAALNNPDDGAWLAIDAKPEYSPLLEANVVYFPKTNQPRENRVSDSANDAPFAIGLIETQGLTAVLEALDTAAKAGNVEVIGREKLGGGYVTVIL